MSMDKPSSSDSPDSGADHGDRRGNRPMDRNGEELFPGAPPDRPAESAPTGPTRSWDDIKADKHRYTSQAEYEAALKERAEHADPSFRASDKPNAAGASGDPGASDRGATGRADGVREPGARRPEGSETERFDRTERPFPGVPLDRPAVPTPTGPVRSWDDIKAEKAKFASQREYEQARAAEKRDPSSPGDTSSKEKDDGRDPARESRSRAAREGTGEGSSFVQGERSRGKERSEADGQDDDSREAGRGETPDGGPATGQERDAPARKPKDQPSAVPQEPDGRADHPDETGAEARPDQQTDEQRWAAMEQRMAARVEATVDQRVRAAAEDIKAEVRAEVTAEYETRLDRQQARIDELGAKLEGTESGQDSVREDVRTTDGQPVQAEKKPDILKTGDLQDDPTASDASAEISQRRKDEPASTERQATQFRERHWVTVKNASAVGSIVSFGSAVGGIFAHLPPEISVGPAAIGAVTGVMGSTIYERVRNRRKDRS